jgi:hypothetical protein
VSGCDLDSFESTTHHDERNTASEKETIRCEDPDAVFALNHPFGYSNLVFALLRTVGIAIFCKIVPCYLVRERLVCFCNVYELRLDLFHCLVNCEFDLVGMELERESFVVLLDPALICRTAQAEDLEWVIYCESGQFGCECDASTEVGESEPTQEKGDNALSLTTTTFGSN